MESYVVLVESSLVVFSSDDGDYFASDGVGGEGDDGVAAGGHGDGAGGAADVGDLTIGFCISSDGVGQGAVGWDVEVGDGRQSIGGLTGGGFCGSGGIRDGDAACAVGDGDAWLLVLRREGVVECYGDLSIYRGAEVNAGGGDATLCDGELCGGAAVGGCSCTVGGRRDGGLRGGGECIGASLEDGGETMMSFTINAVVVEGDGQIVDGFAVGGLTRKSEIQR